MSKTIEEILAPKPQARPRIYAYSIVDNVHARLLKLRQTRCFVNGEGRDAAQEFLF